jgi:hypothetical protein
MRINIRVSNNTFKVDVLARTVAKEYWNASDPANLLRTCGPVELVLGCETSVLVQNLDDGRYIEAFFT